MKNRRNHFLIIAVAILIKFFLFAFILQHAPESRFQNDSRDYLETAQCLSSRMAFAKAGEDGLPVYEYYRTPGYPFFLAFLMGGLKLSVNGVICVQILLAILAAWVIYRVALQIEPRIAFLSSAIFIYEPSVSIFSLQILSEVLFMFVMALFLLSFISYLKNRKIGKIVLAALLLAAATYVRPISYYLGWVVAVFIIYAGTRKGIKKAVIHSLAFLVIIYSFLGLWQERNYKLFGQKYFCNVVESGYKYFGLYKSYSRDKDAQAKSMAPVSYYAKVTARSFLNLMARPGPFKYFKSKTLSVAGNALAYPWMVFWLAGLVIGCLRCGRNIYYQFIILNIAYFIAASIGGVSLLASERFRVPMMPFIAVICAYGWLTLNRKRGCFSVCAGKKNSPSS
ncbi:MAG: glycosyltransferase family 39 protein [Candidatus Omnitrophota bacterium]